MEAFYQPLGDGRYRATGATAGPWDPGSQHGGPPAALLGRAFERTSPRDDLRVARVTVEILGPVPVGELTVRARVARPGRRVELLEAAVEAGGRDVLRAAAWRVAAGDDRAEPVPAPGAPPPRPGPQPQRFWAGVEGFGYGDAIEWRFAEGSFDDPGPASVWTRARIPLVPGEELSGLCRALLVADSGNGVSASLDPTRWWFINPDLTVLLHRHPVGAWVCLEARTVIDAGGVGMAESVLSDDHARVGRGLQSLLVAPR